MTDKQCAMCGGSGHLAKDCGWMRPTPEQVQALGEALLKGEIVRVDGFRFVSEPAKDFGALRAGKRMRIEMPLELRRPVRTPSIAQLFPALRGA